MCVSKGMTAEALAMAATLQRQNTGRMGQAAAMRKEAAPIARINPPAFEGRHPPRATLKTTAGERSRPRLPEPATNPLAVAPASKYRTEISSRKVVLAVSRIPAAAERHNSKKNVLRVRSSGVMTGAFEANEAATSAFGKWIEEQAQLILLRASNSRRQINGEARSIAWSCVDMQGAP